MADRASEHTVFAGLASPGRHGEITGEAGVTVIERRGLGLASITVRAGREEQLRAAILHRFAIALPGGPKHVAVGGVAFVGIGPGRWLALSEADPEARFASMLRADLADLAAVSDQSDGRGVLALRGPRMIDALAKICALDLDPLMFRPGDAAVTMMGHVDVQLWASEAGLDLCVPRSFAASLWHDLRDAAAEYGLDVET